MSRAYHHGMENSVLKIVYTFFVGVMLALFIGFGIDTFYPAPEYPDALAYGWEREPTDAEITEMNKLQQEFDTATENYNLTVSIIVTIAAVGLVGLSLLLEKRNRVLTNGVMLGGLFSLVYGVGRGFASGNSAATFTTIAVGLAVVVFLGFRRFSHKNEPEPEPKPASAPDTSAA